MKRFLQRCCLAVCLASPALCLAGVSHQLGRWFNSIGLSANGTESRVVQAQQGGAFVGGSLVVRAPIRNFQPLTVRVPSISAGCSGISLFNGGFSFVNNAEFKKMGKAVLHSAVGYVAHLAIETLCPSCGNEMTSMEQMAQKINSFNMNSCQVAQGVLGNAAVMLGIHNDTACKGANALGGEVSDYTGATEKCHGRDVEKKKTPKKKGTDEIHNTNIVWDALTKSPFVFLEGVGSAKRQAMNEFMMSFVGTVIVRDKNGKSDEEEVKVVPPVDAKAVIDYLLFGKGGGTTPVKTTNAKNLKAGEEGKPADAAKKPKAGEGKKNPTAAPPVKTYTCKSLKEGEACLWLANKPLTGDKNGGFVESVRDMLHSIENKVSRDTTPLTAAETDFLEKTPYPIVRLLNAYASSSSNTMLFPLDQYAQLIATNLLYSYLDKVVSHVQDAVTGGAIHATETQKKQIQGFVRQAWKSMQSLSLTPMKQMMYAHQMQLQAEQMEGYEHLLLGEKAVSEGKW